MFQTYFERKVSILRTSVSTEFLQRASLQNKASPQPNTHIIKMEYDPEFETATQAKVHEVEMERLCARLKKMLGKDQDFEINDVLGTTQGILRRFRFSTKDLQLLLYAADQKGKYGVVLRI